MNPLRFLSHTILIKVDGILNRVQLALINPVGAVALGHLEHLRLLRSCFRLAPSHQYDKSSKQLYGNRPSQPSVNVYAFHNSPPSLIFCIFRK